MLMPKLFGENLFDDFFEDFGAIRRAPETPARRIPGFNVMSTDIKESADGFKLSIDLAGYNKDDINVSLKDGVLTINAEIRKDTDEKDENTKYIRRERYFGRASRSFYVGELITEEDIKAKYEDGVLNLFVPKKEIKPVVEERKYITIEG